MKAREDALVFRPEVTKNAQFLEKSVTTRVYARLRASPAKKYPLHA